MSDEAKINALGKAAAYQLADVTKTKPQFGMLTPKWTTKFLEFKGLDAGIYRVNRVKEGNTPLEVLCSSKPKSDVIPQGFVDYEPRSRTSTVRPTTRRRNSSRSPWRVSANARKASSSTTTMTAC